MCNNDGRLFCGNVGSFAYTGLITQVTSQRSTFNIRLRIPRFTYEIPITTNLGQMRITGHHSIFNHQYGTCGTYLPSLAGTMQHTPAFRTFLTTLIHLLLYSAD